MTVATFYESDKMIHIKLKGHADYGQMGEDIVCAGVSILVQSLVNAAEGVDFEERDGVITQVVMPKSQYNLGMLDMMRGGMEMLSEEYPDNVSISE